MDSITQAALGAAIGEAVLGKKIGNKGAVLGAIVAMIPDLDVGLYLFYDKFEMLSIHRGYSHSIMFSILGAFLIASVLQRIKWAKQISYLRLWIFTWLALFTHMLLDAFTAYGTQLFLPFSDARIGFDSINVVDPVYTLPLLIGLVCSLFFFKNKPSKTVYNYIGIVVSTLYLLGTLGIKENVKEHFKNELAKQNISYQSLLTMPVGIANVNWYGVAKTEDGLYMHKYSILDDVELPFQYFPSNDHLLNGINPEVVDRMKWFAKGFYTVVKEKETIRFYNLQIDMRGIVKDGDKKAPTVGYFEFVPNENGEYQFSSGAHTAD
ncbi:MAG: inner membrane protein [Saprospiraceae bacterium]|jgi:inner membrane protein